MADRKVSVALELKDGQFRAAAVEDARAVEKLDDKVDKLDRSITKIPPDAAKAAAAMKLIGDETGRASTSMDRFGRQSSLADLDKRIAHTRIEMRALAQEFDRTGDSNVLQRMFRTGGELKELEGLKKRLSGALGDAGAEGGREGAQQFTRTFGAGVQGGLSTPVLGPILGGVIAAAVVAALPAVNALLLSGAGLSGIALGIIGQVRDPAVHQAFADMGNDLMFTLGKATQSFQGPLVNASKLFGSSLKQAIGSIDFGALSKLVEPLASGLGGLVTRMMPGFNRALAAAEPILREFATLLPFIGHGLSDMFAAFARGGPGAQEGLRGLVILLVGLLRIIGFVVEMVSKLAALFIRIGSNVADFFAKATAASEPLHGAFQGLADAFNTLRYGFSEGSHEVIRSLNGMGAAATDAHAELAKMSEELGRNIVTDSTLAAGAVDKLFTSLMNVQRGTLGFEESLTALSDSVKENGRSLDIHTKKGQANAGALLDAAQAAMQLYQAEIASGVSAQDAAAHFDANRDRLYALAHQLHLTKADVDKLIGSMTSVPDTVDSTIVMYGIQDAINRLIELQRRLAGLPTSREISVTTTYYTRAVGPGAELPGRYAHGGIRHAAVGMMIPPSSPGTVLAGEPQTGGEALIPLRGLSQSRAAALGQMAMSGYGMDVVPRGRSAAGGDKMTLMLDLTVRDSSGQVIQRLRKEVDSRGGNVQLAVMGRP